MILYVFPFCFYYLLVKPIRQYRRKDQVMIYGVFAAYLLAMVYYCNYVDTYAQIGMGIPGADMLAHYKGAELYSTGAKWSELSVIAGRFENVGINTIGYFLYTTLLALMAFRFSLVPVEVNIYLVYVVQIMVSINASMRLSRAYGMLLGGKPRRANFFLFFALCVPFAVQSSQLMRDIFYMYFMAIVIEKLVARYYARGTRKTAKHGLVLRFSSQRAAYMASLILLIAAAVLIRFYLVIIIVPLFLYYTGHEKLGMYSAIAMMAALLAGSLVIGVLWTLFGISWNYGAVSIGEFINFLVFPNILNQSTYLMHWNSYFYGVDVGGCNVPGIYYLMAVWNVYVFPLFLAGLYARIKEAMKRRKSLYETVMWFLILINIVALYCITYDSIDNRPKLLMSFSLVFFAAKGFQYLSKRIKHFTLAYNGLITLFVGGLLLLSI